MIDLFLNNSKQTKINIFENILFNEGETNNSLMEKFELTTSSLRRYLFELKEDIKIVFDNQVMLNKQNNINVIEILSPKLNVNEIVLQLQFFYIKDNPLYIFLKAIIFKQYHSIIELSQDLNYSEANTYKLLAETNEILSFFGGKLTFKGKSNIDGDEIGIRYFLYLIFWNFFRTLEGSTLPQMLPEKYRDIDFLKKQLNLSKNLSHSQTIKLKILSGITSYRLVFYKKTIQKDKNFLHDISLFSNGYLPLNIQDTCVPEPALKKESLIFVFLTHGLIYDLYTYAQKEEIVKRYKNSNLDVSTQVSSFMEQLTRVLSLKYSEDNYTETYYLLLIAFIYIKYFNFEKVDKFLSTPITQRMNLLKGTKRYSLFNEHLKQLLEESHYDKSFSPNQIDVLILLTYAIYEINRKPETLHVYINNSTDITTALLIKSKLKQYFNPSLISFCESPYFSDLIISDTIEGKNLSPYHFYFVNIFNKKTWGQLINYINNIIINESII